MPRYVPTPPAEIEGPQAHGRAMRRGTARMVVTDG
jgi:hypothetical protein